MKIEKRVIILIILISLFILSNNIIAQEKNTQVDKAYTCFESEVGNDCGNTKSTRQNAFNLLAASYKSDLQSSCKSSLKQKIKENCWGETDTGVCNIKSTALSILALDHVNENVKDYVDWLKSKRINEKELTWFIEIDANNKTECTINGQKITIDNNKKILGNVPNGLLKAYNDYWFEIKDTSKDYSISCDRDFITALLFLKPGSSAYHISSETKFAYLYYGTVIDRVNSYCFSTSNICDYEGSLWATLVLAKLGEDISNFLPYITAMSDKTENKKYIPSSFLYILTHSDDYYNDLVSLQRSGGYWDESKNKFYDTALALFALLDVDSGEVDNAKRYLLSNQKESGCWPSDTSFILHAAWPKTPTVSGGGVSLSACEDFGKFCVSIGECLSEDTLNNFYCSSSSQVCCNRDFIEPTCSEKRGVICNQEETCEGQKVLASDTNECCQGDCVLVDLEPQCEKELYVCRSTCSENEEEKISYSNSCDVGEICCGKKPVEKKQTGFLLIVILIILIILVILAIIFRNKLKSRFKAKDEGSKKQELPRTPPTFSPPVLRPPLFRRPALPVGRIPPRQFQKLGNKDKEFEETMKKLKDMSK